MQANNTLTEEQKEYLLKSYQIFLTISKQELDEESLNLFSEQYEDNPDTYNIAKRSAQNIIYEAFSIKKISELSHPDTDDEFLEKISKKLDTLKSDEIKQILDSNENLKNAIDIKLMLELIKESKTAGGKQSFLPKFIKEIVKAQKLLFVSMVFLQCAMTVCFGAPLLVGLLAYPGAAQAIGLGAITTLPATLSTGIAIMPTIATNTLLIGGTVTEAVLMYASFGWLKATLKTGFEAIEKIERVYTHTLSAELAAKAGSEVGKALGEADAKKHRPKN